MKSFKAVKFGYRQTSETRQILETFRTMVNHAINISLTEGVRGRLKLRDRVYKEFQERYGVVSRYPYSVAEIAWSIVKKHRRWHRVPVARRLMMKMDATSYFLNHALLSLPSKKGERLLIPLEYGDYQRAFLVDETVKRGSVTMTERAVFIVFSKETEAIAPLSKVGIEREIGCALRRNHIRPIEGGPNAYGVRHQAQGFQFAPSTGPKTKAQVLEQVERERTREAIPPPDLEADS